MSLITNQNQLQKICDSINSQKITAIDTEFIRENTFLPILCLIQINVDGNCYAIDPLSKLNLEPLFTIINNPNIIKIFHSARQDLEVLFLNFPKQISPKNIIDTQIMAAFCEMGLSVSYGNLAKNLLDKEIDKECQRSDWQQRPLSENQINYAKIDVLYLPEIYQILYQKLVKENKSEWLKDEMELGIQKAIEEDIYKKFPLIGKNESYKKNINLLAEWRNQIAKRNNIPRSFVIKDEVLDKIATYHPKTTSQLEKCGFKTRVFNCDVASEILNLIQQNNEIPNNKTNDRTWLDEEQKILLQKSKILLQDCATRFTVSKELIINQTNLSYLISGHKSIDEILFGWRYLVFGEELKKLL